MFRSMAALAILGCAATQLSAQQWAQEARTALNAPAKVAFSATDQAPKANAPLNYVVTIEDSRGQPSALPHDAKIQVDLIATTGTGGVVLTSICPLAARNLTAQCALTAPAAGLYKIRVVPVNHEVCEGSGYLLVVPQPKTPAAKPTPTNTHGARLEDTQELPLREQRQPPPYHLSLALFQSPPVTNTPAPATCASTPVSKSKATILLTVDEGGESNGAFRAGLDTATVTAFFRADDGGAAPRNIQVWLQQDHGNFDVAPLVIPRCNISGAAHLSSSTPANATIAYSTQGYPVAGPPKLEARFVRPIVGIGILPKGVQSLSLIDQAPIVTQFFDAAGNIVPTDVDRKVTFVSSNTIMGPKIQTVALKSGDQSAPNIVMPYGTGNASLYVTADGLQVVTHEVRVVGAVVFALWVIGGLLGGVVAHFTGDKQALLQRLFIGIASGTVVSWAYVFGLLPKVDASVAHNYASVFVVAFLGGYMGIKGIELVLNKLGWQPTPSTT